MNQLDEALARIELKIDRINAIVNSIEETEKKIFILEQVTSAHNEKINLLATKIQKLKDKHENALWAGAISLASIISFLIYNWKITG